MWAAVMFAVWLPAGGVVSAVFGAIAGYAIGYMMESK